VDLFSAIFEESQGVPVSIIRRHGVEPELLVARIATRMRDIEQREERLRKRFELPPFLKHFATNLNQMARQDRIPPLFGRTEELRQVMEILCHRERANSVMLIGEPGVGKTAIVEGLARRIEFEPESVPVRLRDCQVVNLQMNSMVAGTMLRGMFEDRIQNVIREIKEHPNLILFVDEVHTMIRSCPRRSPDDRRDDAQRVQRIHPGGRGARAPVPDGSRGGAGPRGDATHHL
jgi:ATP-dependent Clp protease ATP-binding subunit ClpA